MESKVDIEYDPRGYWELDIEGGPTIAVQGLTRFALALALNEGGGHVPTAKGRFSVSVMPLDAPRIVLIYYEEGNYRGSYTLSPDDSLALYKTVSRVNQIKWGE